MTDSSLRKRLARVVTREDCRSAPELLDRLSPRRDWKPWPQAWVFRGQSQEWPLKAKLHRSRRWFTEFQQPTPADRRGNHDAVRLSGLLARFADELNRAGLSVPTPLPVTGSGNSSWLQGEPPKHLLPTLALAQHHGLPTPWLDWSYQPRAAAYFACAGLVGKSRAKPKSKLVVWALRREWLGYIADDAGDTPDVDGVYLSLESAPRAGNARLHAQSGLFTWLHGDNARRRTLDQHVRQLARLHPDAIDTPLMRCLTLDVGHAAALLELLADEGVTAATIYPGCDGVVQTMREQAWVMNHLRAQRR